MGRILWILPLCLIFQGQSIFREVTPGEVGLQEKRIVQEQRKFNPTERHFVCQDLVGTLGFMPSAGVPGGLPWYAMYQIGKKDLFPLENILVYQPALFFQMCLDRYDREIQGYTVLFCKHEPVKGKHLKSEKIIVHFREKPFSVHFNWQEGGGLAKKVLYVEGENEGKMKVKTKFGITFTKDPDGSEAMATSRFSIKQFGVQIALKSTVASILRAQAAGTLHLKFDGLVEAPELGGRKCYKFVRAPYDPPEEDGICGYVFYIDKETWMQVGSQLKNRNGELIAEYFFRDLRPNPQFEEDQFTEKALR